MAKIFPPGQLGGIFFFWAVFQNLQYGLEHQSLRLSSYRSCMPTCWYKCRWSTSRPISTITWRRFRSLPFNDYSRNQRHVLLYSGELATPICPSLQCALLIHVTDYSLPLVGRSSCPFFMLKLPYRSRISRAGCIRMVTSKSVLLLLLQAIVLSFQSTLCPIT